MPRGPRRVTVATTRQLAERLDRAGLTSAGVEAVVALASGERLDAGGGGGAILSLQSGGGGRKGEGGGGGGGDGGSTGEDLTRDAAPVGNGEAKISVG